MKRATPIYTDGSILRNPGGLSGWAWVIPDGPCEWGAVKDSTNQRMELQAAHQAMMANRGMVEILTDSAYVANCFNQRWWRSWNRRGWKSAQGKTIKNQDLWRPMIDLYLERGNITFTHVRGHQGVYWNEMADLLAHRAATLQSNGRADEMIPPGEFLSRLSKPSRQRLLAKIRADVLSQ